jgi:hypothetical protein
LDEEHPCARIELMNDALGVALFVTGVWIIPGIFTGLIARSKGYDPVVFGFLSVFSLLGTLFALFVLSDRTETPS